jgi:hypothetical protein
MKIILVFGFGFLKFFLVFFSQVPMPTSEDSGMYEDSSQGFSQIHSWLWLGHAGSCVFVTSLSLSLSLFLSLSLSLTHTLTRSLCHTRTLTHALTFFSLSNTHTRTLSLSHTHSLTHTHTVSCICSWRGTSLLIRIANVLLMCCQCFCSWRGTSLLIRKHPFLFLCVADVLLMCC